jgi:2-polyprenyl-3-methyl-5-hydroxy-6-metoxy-1,4-benzoquinol methylase
MPTGVGGLSSFDAPLLNLKQFKMSKFSVFLQIWRPKLAKSLGVSATDKEELSFLLRAIGHKVPDRTHYPEWGKEKFLRQLPPDARILDVGCGNDSPQFTKNILPNSIYVGLDVGDYNQSRPDLADQYVIASPQEFCGKIADFGGGFDAVISSHNLEHCDDRDGVLVNMLDAVKPGGILYLAFPSADSMRFPSRKGTLNYLDDVTHKGTPPDFGKIISVISGMGFEVVYAASRYQPAVKWLIGLYHEAKSVANEQVDMETQAFWGLEAIIWARRPVAQGSSAP